MRGTIRALISILILIAGWSVVPAAVAKSPSDRPSSLYLLEPQYGRVLLPLNPDTLADAPVFSGPIVFGRVTAEPPASLPNLFFSPDRSKFAYLTTSCPQCRAWERRYHTLHVFDAQTGIQIRKSHPRYDLTYTLLSNDGTRLSGLKQPGSKSGYRWITLDTRTGNVLSRSDSYVPSTIWPPESSLLVDVSHDRGYFESLDDGPGQTGPTLGVSAIDLAHGQVTGHIMFPSIPYGWRMGNTNSSADPVFTGGQPAVALSPDGSKLAVVDSATNTLTLVDAPAMKVLSTRTLTQPSSPLQTLLSTLGLLPNVAEAKEFLGTTLSGVFSADGTSVLVYGTRTQLDAKGNPVTTGLGLERIDVATGQITATGLAGETVLWLGEAPRGTDLYVMYNRDGTSVLDRLDEHTLQVTATRTFDTSPALYIIGS